MEIIFHDFLESRKGKTGIKEKEAALERWLGCRGVLAALVEDVGLVPSIHRAAHQDR